MITQLWIYGEAQLQQNEHLRAPKMGCPSRLPVLWGLHM